MSEERVLIVGGCGFVGYHVVNAFIQDSSWSSIHVMSRDPSRNQVEGAHYHSGSITSFEQLRSLLAKIQPSVVIHTASPVEDADDGRYFEELNVKGTRNLLRAAIASGHVRAFIYTSSVEVIEGSSHKFVTEDAQMITSSSRAPYYQKTKAIADQAVLDANGTGGLRTLCLRLAGVYGERDSQMIPNSLHALQEGRNRYQIGDNKSLFDYGNSVPFWTFERQIWSAAGDKTPLEEVRVVPAWVVLNLASAVEWLYWAFTLGLKRPKVFRRQIMIYTCSPRTYSIQKARERLGYKPVDDRDEQIQRGLEWAIRVQKEAA